MQVQRNTLLNKQPGDFLTRHRCYVHYEAVVMFEIVDVCITR